MNIEELKSKIGGNENRAAARIRASQTSPAIMASDQHLENGVDGDDEREEDDEEEEEDDEQGEEEEEEEEEPRLKYQRLGGSVPSLLSTDAASSIAIAERMIALGTHDGTVHILDFQGNQVFLLL